MSAIIHGVINFMEVVRLDLFDAEFELITNVNLTGKKLILQVKINANDKLLLSFNEDDGSLIHGVPSPIENTDKTTRTITLHKHANLMTLPAGNYKHGCACYSDETDKQLLLVGAFQVVDEIPLIPAL
jgi:hypothetical protein